MRVLISPHSHQHLLLCISLYYKDSSECEVCVNEIHCGSELYFSDGYCAKYLFMCLLDIGISLEKYLFRYFAQVLIKLLFISELCEFFTYSKTTWLAHTFSHSVPCLFTFLIWKVSLVSQKFYFWQSPIYPRNHCPTQGHQDLLLHFLLRAFAVAT